MRNGAFLGLTFGGSVIDPRQHIGRSGIPDVGLSAFLKKREPSFQDTAVVRNALESEITDRYVGSQYLPGKILLLRLPTPVESLNRAVESATDIIEYQKKRGGRHLPQKR